MRKFSKLFGSVLISGCLVLSSFASVFAAKEEILKGDGKLLTPTAEQKKIDEQKSKEAEAYYAKKTEKKTGGISTQAVVINPNGDKYNSVGLFRQSKGYTCGPTSARNLINGYVYYNYTFPGKPGGVVPSEATLESELGTTSAGTDFGTSKWQTVLKKYTGRTYTTSWGTSTGWETSLKTKIISTIDNTKCYNVVGNINHGATSTPIHSVYANGAAHYICVYGYNDKTKEFMIADSNSKAPVQFRCSYTALANSTKARGVIW